MITTLSHIYSNAQAAKNKAFLVSNKKLSYKDTLQTIMKIGGLFKELDISLGDKIAVLSNNDEEVILLFLASLFYGVTFCILDEDIKEKRVQSVLQYYGAKKLFIDKDKKEALKLSASDISMMIIDTHKSKAPLFNFFSKKNAENHDTDYFYRIKNTKESMPIMAQIDENKIALVLFTSGTTSHPKGVALSYKNLFSHLATLKKVYNFNETSKSLNILPLSHADGLIQGPLLSFYANATLFRPFIFKIQKINELMEQPKMRKISHMFATPTMLTLIHSYTKEKKSIFSYKEFHTIISVAAALEAKLYTAFNADFSTSIINVYGLTETVAGSLFTDPNKDQAGYIGFPVDCEVKIVDEEGMKLEDEMIGELLLKGPHIMNGYFNDTIETDNVLKKDWFYTGDLAKKTAHGYMIVGRKKSAIISGGFTIYPEEISELLNTHPYVLESTTFGRENAQWGEEIISAVLLNNNSKTSEKELIEYARQNLENYKVPRFIYILDSLPKGRSGKVQIEALKGMLSTHKAKTTSIEETIFQIAAESFMEPMEAISITSSSETLMGWDSMGHLDFIMLLEEKFSITLKTVDVLKIDTIEDAIMIVKSKI